MRGGNQSRPSHPSQGGYEEVTQANKLAAEDSGGVDEEANEPELPRDLIEPIGDIVLVRVLRRNITKAGLLLPDNASQDSGESTPSALVVSTGPMVAQCLRGDKVKIPALTQAIILRHEGLRVLAVNESRIAGIVNEPMETRAKRAGMSVDNYMTYVGSVEVHREEHRKKLNPNPLGSGGNLA